MIQDSHLHLQDARLWDKVPEIVHSLEALGINKLVVNGTTPEDWDKVTKLSHQYPELVIPSYGLHPWKTPCNQSDWKETLEQLVVDTPNSCIGECGLDKWVRNPNIEAQQDAFLYQLKLAAHHNRPLSIHVLKAWSWLLECLHTQATPARGFLIHSYGGSIETAQQLCKIGAYFSFSGYFLQERKKNVQEAFRHIPIDRILVETDAPDMRAPDQFITHPLDEKTNHPANLVATARGLAAQLDKDFEELCVQLEENFTRFFLTE